MMQNYQTLKKIFTFSDYNKSTSENLDAKIINEKLVNESDISEFINKSYLKKRMELTGKGEPKAEK